MGISIKNDEVEALARQLASKHGKGPDRDRPRRTPRKGRARGRRADAVGKAGADPGASGEGRQDGPSGRQVILRRDQRRIGAPVIVVDASAIVGIMAEESDSRDLSERLQALPSGPGQRIVSTETVWEAAVAMARLWRIERPQGFFEVGEFLKAAQVMPIAPDMAITTPAVEASERYGMGGGRPGILNLGDCFSYATAKHLKARLLFKGDDFSRTDVAPA
jgi:ribonuclease VapC